MALILLIDDDDGWRTVLREVLRLEGHEVLEGFNGTHGVELCHEFHPDLVITDIVMPDKEGLETIGEIRLDFPDTPIIAMSGGGDFIRKEDYLPMAQQMGACATLPKPMSREVLLEAVRAALANRGSSPGAA